MATGWSDSAEEFSLPDEFLDDDFFSEEEKAAVAARSESDEEDYGLTGLSLRLAGILGDNGGRKSAHKEEVTVGSPQSTLCGLPKSGQETPTGGASKGNSPPSSPLMQRPADPWEVLYEAADEVARMRACRNNIPAHSNTYGFNSHSAFVLPARKPSPPPAPVTAPAAKVSVGGYYHPFAHQVTQRQMQAAQFHLLKQQQLLKLHRERKLAVWMAQQGARAKGSVCGGNNAPFGANQAAFPPLQKQHNHAAPPPASPGMRAVFLNPPGAKRERTGTGVFLPRPAGFSPAEPEKKSGCSTVLVPARVVQALNLNLDDFGAQPCYPGGFVLNHDALINRSNAILASQKRSAAGAALAPALCRSS